MRLGLNGVQDNPYPVIPKKTHLVIPKKTHLVSSFGTVLACQVGGYIDPGCVTPT